MCAVPCGGVEESEHSCTAGPLKPNHQAGGASGHCPPGGGHFGNAAAPTACARPSGSAGYHRLAEGIIGLCRWQAVWGPRSWVISLADLNGELPTQLRTLGFGAGTRVWFHVAQATSPLALHPSPHRSTHCSLLFLLLMFSFC